MTRTYDRDTIQWVRADLDALVAAGQATLFASGIYVVKQPEGGSIAVRPHQILDDSSPVRFIPQDDVAANVAVALGDVERRARAEALVEEIFTLRHGIAENRDGEFHDEERAMVQRILDDEDGEYAHALNEELWDARHAAEQEQRRAAIASPRGQHWAFSPEADALLARFTK